MAATGFNLDAGKTWVVNELSSAVRSGTPSARQNDSLSAHLSPLALAHRGDHSSSPFARSTPRVTESTPPSNSRSSIAGH